MDGFHTVNDKPPNNVIHIKMPWLNYQFLDYFGVAYSLGMMALLFTSGVWLVLPFVYEDQPDVLQNRILFACYLLFNSIANFILTYTIKSDYKPSKYAYVSLPDASWSKCVDCDEYKPPRTHHCILCKKCILKRDHHCFFVATCIGYHNQRHFLALCFHVTLASLYGFHSTYVYITMEYFSILSSDVYHVFLPITLVKCMLGYTSFLLLFLLTLMWLSVISSIGIGGIFLWQSYVALFGITAHELSKGRQIYRSWRFLENIRSVFGPWWIVQFIVPMPFIKLRGDGTRWYHSSKTV